MATQQKVTTTCEQGSLTGEGKCIEGFSGDVMEKMEQYQWPGNVRELKTCNWKVYGPGGAAELPDIHVSTLNSRMKKLGITKTRVAKGQ